jgi:hypothetical protein
MKTSQTAVRVYYSDDFGETITLSKQQGFGGIGGNSAHANGSASCHESDSGRVALVTQRGSSARVMVTTDRGDNWAAYSTASLANAFQMVWSGDRLVLIYDAGSSVRIRISDQDGASITQVASLGQEGGNRSDQVGVIPTIVDGLLFAFAYDSGVTSYVLRSTDNGDTWEQIGSFPTGVSSPNALVYDADSDHLYSAWGGGAIRALPVAETRTWGEVEGSDWVVLSSVGGELGDRTLALDGNGAIGLLGP